MRRLFWLAAAAIVLAACGGGRASAPLPTTAAPAAEIVLDGETLVAVRSLPPQALAADKLEAAGTAEEAGAGQMSVARASSGGVARWEYVSSTAGGWQVWQPKSIRDAQADAGADARIVSVEAVEWNDACLGAARDGEVCAQVVTPGYRVVVTQGGSRIEYHAGRIAGIRRLP
jgi:hypothetical protein